LSPEVPAGENPPPGAIFYYYLSSPAKDEVKLEVLDNRGQTVRSYSSNDKPATQPANAPFPQYWFRPTERPASSAGMHRFVWDLRYSAPPLSRIPGYSMSTVFGRSVPLEPEGPQALPGKYSLRIAVDGKTLTQPFELTMDPRVKVSADDLRKQFDLETQLAQSLRQADEAIRLVHEARAANRINEEQETRLVGRAANGGEPDQESRPTFTRAAANLRTLISGVDSADAAPTAQQSAAAAKVQEDLKQLLAEWQKLKP